MTREEEDNAKAFMLSVAVIMDSKLPLLEKYNAILSLARNET